MSGGHVISRTYCNRLQLYYILFAYTSTISCGRSDLTKRLVFFLFLFNIVVSRFLFFFQRGCVYCVYVILCTIYVQAISCFVRPNKQNNRFYFFPTTMNLLFKIYAYYLKLFILKYIYICIMHVVFVQ